uniref:Uncharacterized protein n=1 Tax=Siphoviridae sp. ctGsX68 TaxID=2825417 RepID=A0A8S5UU92_9CAUD|nr:MAG TPA: Protein of unknown function (DUF806) [Siphoviridae sp. ctGsX68]DAU88648.1 MAG TPA: Protein of unknown function (DUF806) [Caudoviricetes sp.]
MIDIFDEVFMQTATALRNKFSKIRVTGEYAQTPVSYPAVTLDEIDNIETEADSSDRERYNRVRYRVQVFSNKSSGKRAEARSIQKEIDLIFKSMGFKRTSYSPTPDIINNTVYCITTVFSAVVDENGYIHGTEI